MRWFSRLRSSANPVVSPEPRIYITTGSVARGSVTTLPRLTLPAYNTLALLRRSAAALPYHDARCC